MGESETRPYEVLDRRDFYCWANQMYENIRIHIHRKSSVSVPVVEFKTLHLLKVLTTSLGLLIKFKCMKI